MAFQQKRPTNCHHSSLVTWRKSEMICTDELPAVRISLRKNSASQESRALRELTKPGVARWRGRLLPLRRFFPKNFGIVV